jgi:hypothetical protein
MVTALLEKPHRIPGTGAVTAGNEGADGYPAIVAQIDAGTRDDARDTRPNSDLQQRIEREPNLLSNSLPGTGSTLDRSDDYR